MNLHADYNNLFSDLRNHQERNQLLGAHGARNKIEKHKDQDNLLSSEGLQLVAEEPQSPSKDGGEYRE